MRKTYDPTDLPEQERLKAEDDARAQLAQNTEDDDFKWLMSSRRGRAIVWRLLAEAGTSRISFVPGQPDLTAFNEGNRNYGNKVQSIIQNLCPELYLAMLKEGTNDRKRIDRSSDAGN